VSGCDSVATASETYSDCDDNNIDRMVSKRHKRDMLDGLGHHRGLSANWTNGHYPSEHFPKTPHPSISVLDTTQSHLYGTLTPPHRQQRLVEMQGPAGFTALHVASMTPAGADMVPYIAPGSRYTQVVPRSAAIIQDLITDGANVHSQIEFSGETPLHLAARFCRADAAKRLLAAGADPTAQDNNGRTPLHAAAASCCTVLSR